jgi:hypothetical protein
MLAEKDVLAAASRLACAAGLPRALACERIEGGRNNRVYKVTLESGDAVLLKSYYADERDPRDRLEHEWAFLTYAWERNVRAIPQPLARERETHSGLYSFLPGRKLRAGEVEGRHVDAAAEFVCALNAERKGARDLPPGSEACFTLGAHLAAIERRVERLKELDPAAPGRAAADRLVRAEIVPLWHMVKNRILRQSEAIGPAPEASIDPASVCVSPSDFGFHNALVDGARIAFIDFEYAGRDDPAKLVCDFFCQPEVPVPPAFYDRFLGRVAEGLRLTDADRARCDLLLDAYRVKWVCIMLNEYLPLDAARRSFAGGDGARAERCAGQLARAAKSVEQIRTRAISNAIR